MNLQPAIDLQRQGRLSEAEAACRRIVAVHPKNAGAFHLLGNIALQRGQVDQAIQMFYKAVTLAPDTPQFRVNLAAVLGQAGRPSEAVPHLAHALRLKGDAPELHNNMGAILEALDRLPEALSSLRNALRLRPDY